MASFFHEPKRWETIKKVAEKVIYRTPVREGVVFEPKLAACAQKLRERYAELGALKNKKTAVLIEKTPEVVNEARQPIKCCGALTMAGKKCPFKACAGNYCKKHAINPKSLPFAR